MLDDKTRNEIINKYFNNEATPTMISKEYCISVKSVWTIITKFKTTGTVNSKNYLKGRIKEENIDYKERYEILKKYQAFLKAQREKK